MNATFGQQSTWEHGVSVGVTDSNIPNLYISVEIAGGRNKAFPEPNAGFDLQRIVALCQERREWQDSQQVQIDLEDRCYEVEKAAIRELGWAYPHASSVLRPSASWGNVGEPRIKVQGQFSPKYLERIYRVLEGWIIEEVT